MNLVIEVNRKFTHYEVRHALTPNGSFCDPRFVSHVYQFISKKQAREVIEAICKKDSNHVPTDFQIVKVSHSERTV